MNWTSTCFKRIRSTPPQFEKAVGIWVQRPNVCSKIISCAQLSAIKDIKDNGPLLEILEKIGLKCSVEGETVGNDFFVVSRRAEFFLRKFVPKKPHVHSSCFELIILDKAVASFVPISENFELSFGEFCYQFGIFETKSKLDQVSNHDEDANYILKLNTMKMDHPVTQANREGSTSRNCHPTLRWIEENLFPCVEKWSCQVLICGKSQKSALPTSLSLIPQHEYAEKYQYLKEKYGKQLVKFWPEVTDPEKFVYEDIAIATYLILLWKNEREIEKMERLQTFLDMGCGNGLLVHILNSEGHPGKGVDVRRRKIWDIFPPTTNLVEGIIDPTSGALYSEFDWLLGNHSDELTPWIPVLAARSGYGVRYWVLPCCFHDFFVKYERAHSTLGQYDDYLAFVRKIGKVCGFDVETDVMRIPSTKRVCHVGRAKTYLKADHADILKRIDDFVQERKSLTSSFQAREKVEKVRNCTKMERSVQAEIVQIIVTKLLEEKNYVEIRNGEFCSNSANALTQPKGEKTSFDIHNDGTKQDKVELWNDDCGGSSEQTKRKIVSKLWNRGGTLKLHAAALLLPAELKTLMKSECGGLQTLLRNHHQVFEIINGSVGLRDWSKPDLRSKKRRKANNRFAANGTKTALKTRRCYFYDSHPDGCPRIDEHCPFLHG